MACRSWFSRQWACEMLPGKEQNERGEEKLNAVFLPVTQLLLCRDKESNKRAGGYELKKIFFI